MVAYPPVSTATQKVDEVHESASIVRVASTTLGVDHEVPLKTVAYPEAPTATQNVAERHLTTSKARVPLTSSALFHWGVAAGVVVAAASSPLAWYKYVVDPEGVVALVIWPAALKA